MEGTAGLSTSSLEYSCRFKYGAVPVLSAVEVGQGVCFLTFSLLYLSVLSLQPNSSKYRPIKNLGLLFLILHQHLEIRGSGLGPAYVIQ